MGKRCLKLTLSTSILLSAAGMVLFAIALPACRGGRAPEGEKGVMEGFVEARKRMVEEQIRRRGISDPRVLRAMEEVPRHLFVPPAELHSAYDDTPLPIGYGQTISQPYIVALMTDVLRLRKEDKVLEIGTGSGYQAAVLAELAGDVYTIEIVEPLGTEARERLERLGCTNVHVRIGDGYKGWPEEQPFDAIIVTAAPETIPHTLVEQLADGGRMVIPVGRFFQELVLLTRRGERVDKKVLTSVRFVPMVSEEEKE